MCRKLALAATALALPLFLGTAPAFAFGFGQPAAKTAAAPAAGKTAPPAPAKPAADPKATPEERAAADRMEPMGRAAFWASQVSADPKDTEAGLKLASALRALGRYQEAFEAAGQVLVLHDMLDVYPGKKAKFVKNYMRPAGSIQGAVELYVKEVKARAFPGPEHSF